METRSQRQQAIQRPAYPQISTSVSIAASESSASSAFNSSSSLASVQAPGSLMASSVPAFGQQTSAAPLPSPLLAGQQGNYFGSINASTSAQQTQQAAYVGQRGGGGGAPETAPFLDNFNLVAEAAKRAQMACLMRDLGDVEL